VFLASQPSAADFEQAAKGGVRTVLNIRHDAEQPDMDERASEEDARVEARTVGMRSPAYEKRVLEYVKSRS
jgi:protein tyrosine phosphatase (PTP) superfamily phosphohydrolase (DUF442 family)